MIGELVLVMNDAEINSINLSSVGSNSQTYH